MQKYKKEEDINLVLGLNLLGERIFGDKYKQDIYKKGKSIGKMLIKYNCYEKAFKSITKFHKDINKMTITGAAIIATIIKKPNLEYLIKKI
ncbi:MAG: hypothetical protein QW041_01785 [Candidatus Pacearchaeota archaeon]